MTNKLALKVALITRGNRGIGLATAQRFVAGSINGVKLAWHRDSCNFLHSGSETLLPLLPYSLFLFCVREN